MKKNRVSPKVIRDQLKRICESSGFRESERMTGFLRFVVEETLAGRASQLKGYTIGLSVFGKKEDFDPTVDPIVRVQAGRIRRALETYYLTDGKADPVLIQIPKGTYVPKFHHRETVQEDVHPDQVPDRGEEPEGRGHVVSGPSIAVLPFENLSDDPDQEYFSDGITEEIIGALTRFDDLSVIARHSTLPFKNREVDFHGIGRDLGVRFVLEGTVRREGDRVRVTASLVDVSTAERLWSENYDRSLTTQNLFSIEDNIAQVVSARIASCFGVVARTLWKQTRNRRTEDLEVYDALLRYFHYLTMGTNESFDTAFRALERAVEVDSECGRAWAKFSEMHCDAVALGFAQIEHAPEKAESYARRALSLDPMSQDAHFAMAYTYLLKKNPKMVVQEAEKALALNPNSAYMVGKIGFFLVLAGEFDRGLEILRDSFRLNPYYPVWLHYAIFLAHFCRGEYEEALEEIQPLQLPPSPWNVLLRAAALGHLGRSEEANILLEEFLALYSDIADRIREYIGYFVLDDVHVEAILTGLKKAGLTIDT